MSALAHVMPPSCHPDSDWQLINPGATSHTHSTIVAACQTCGAEWHLTLLARRIAGPLPQNGTRRSSDDIDDAYRRAVNMVRQGATIAEACREARIGREIYTRRRNGKTRAGALA
jgi:hypothetical protein